MGKVKKTRKLNPLTSKMDDRKKELTARANTNVKILDLTAVNLETVLFGYSGFSFITNLNSEKAVFQPLTPLNSLKIESSFLHKTSWIRLAWEHQAKTIVNPIRGFLLFFFFLIFWSIAGFSQGGTVNGKRI